MIAQELADSESIRRWTFWVLLIWTGVQLLLVIFIVPETYMPVLLRREAVKLRKETGEERWYAPIEKMDRSIPQVSLIFCAKSDEVNFSHADHHALML